ncbi:J domain-containing protein [Calothrix sp. 336/3]|uniref:J domain-containing protein n=1 Tax=Calothrix sp. 336/3 TaxID=1337936 RepID=UPI000624DCF0|nr:J domain-containing protein [Calothrix sp. 336/3]AKG23874.1 molecular chaperone DnaJ [Calothrix sp. 336/3]
MPRKSSASERTVSPTTLALSEYQLRLLALEKEHQRLLNLIKKKRTELNNFVTQMRSVATEMFSQGMPSMQKMAELDEEIHNLFQNIFKTRKFGKQTQKKVEDIYRRLQLSGVISFKPTNIDQDDTELDDMFGNFSEEDFFREAAKRRQEHQNTESETISPSASRSEDSRKIRTSFLRLAEIFHPDKATDRETQQRHTEIMKEINRAYQDGDLARLIEIEQKYQVGETIDSNNEDDVNKQCQKIEQHNQLLQNQYETLKRELSQVKRTPEGEIVADYRKVKKAGFDPVSQMLEQLESQISIISDIRNFVKDFHDEKITIKEFIAGPQALETDEEEILSDLLEEMMAELGEVIIVQTSQRKRKRRR